MPSLPPLPLRWLRDRFRSKRRDAEMAEELEAHLHLQTEQNLRAGLPPEEARYAALRAFGGVEQVKERCREYFGWRWLAELKQDLRYGVRALRQHRTFTVLAVLTLGLGIGVNATIFSAVEDLIFRPTLRDRRLGLVALHTARVGAERSYRPFNYAEFTAARQTHDVFSDVAAMQFSYALVGEPEALQRRFLCLVSANYFSVLDVRPAQGRFFTEAECQPDVAPPILVASHEYWQRLGGRPDFVGSRQVIDGHAYTVVGIAPAGFGGLHWSNGPDAWLPLGQARNMAAASRGGRSLLDPRATVLQVFGRLQPGLTLDAAKARLAPLTARLNEAAGATEAEKRILSLGRPSRVNFDVAWPNDESGLTIYAVSSIGMTIAVLLVACLNLANMLFSRGLARRREIAIRLCLGASRGRVIRQLLVEGLLLALLGGIVGLLSSRAANEFLLDLTSRRSGATSFHLRTTADGLLLAATFGLCLIATLGFSLLPAVRATRLNLVEDLKQQGGEAFSADRWSRFFSLRHTLAMLQVALSVMLLFAAGLLVRSVSTSEHDRGFTTERSVVANVDYFLGRVPTEAVPARQRTLLTAVERMAGVESVALASGVPFNFEANGRSVYPVGTGHDSSALYTVVSHGYFATMGIPLLRGRDFTAAEARDASTPRVAIIDETLGRTLFGDEDPVGRRIALAKSEADGRHGAQEIEIIGIVHSPREDTWQGQTPMRRLYRPFSQAPGGMINTYVHVRLAPGVPTAAFVEALRSVLRSTEIGAPVLVCEPLADLLARNLNVWTARLLAGLFSLFGLVAAVLAMVGVYGVKAYLVTRRTREVGIRIAVGADRKDVLGLFMRQSILQTVAGLAAGAGLAILAGMFLSKLLYRVQGADPLVLALSVGLLATVSLAASFVPAWRATRINPTEALRVE